MKALCVFSGGLDSILAAELIKAQGIDVLAIFFETPFFKAINARKSADFMGLPFKIVDIAKPHLNIVKNPPHGYGRNMNPCIDCHALMFRVAGEMLAEEGADFVITGEVLGQRPMSQNKYALDLVAAKSNIPGLLLRPLSARLLQATIPEEKGWINMSHLMDFQGRTRKPQMALAERFGIKEYPPPAGGCLLTEKAFSRRLQDLFDHQKIYGINEIELLKYGRHFRLGCNSKVIVGRNKTENQALLNLKDDRGCNLQTISEPGPVVLVYGDVSATVIEIAASLTAAYSDIKTGDTTFIKVVKNKQKYSLSTMAVGKEKFRDYMI